MPTFLKGSLPTEQSADCGWSAWADKKKAWSVVVHSLYWVLPADGVLLVAVMDEDHHKWVLVERDFPPMWRLSELTHQFFQNFLFCRTNCYFKTIYSDVLITQNQGA